MAMLISAADEYEGQIWVCISCMADEDEAALSARLNAAAFKREEDLATAYSAREQILLQHAQKAQDENKATAERLAREQAARQTAEIEKSAVAAARQSARETAAAAGRR